MWWKIFNNALLKRFNEQKRAYIRNRFSVLDFQYKGEHFKRNVMDKNHVFNQTSQIFLEVLNSMSYTSKVQHIDYGKTGKNCVPFVDLLLFGDFFRNSYFMFLV